MVFSWLLCARVVAWLGYHAGPECIAITLAVLTWAALTLPVYFAMGRYARRQELERNCEDLREVLHAMQAERARLRELRRHPVTARLLVLGTEWDVRSL